MDYTSIMYYIYAHKKPDGEVFYVGKGSGKRQFFISNRNEYWKRVVAKYGFESFLLEDGLSEPESYEAEVKWISYYRNQGQCKANFTNGGDGVRVDKRWWGAAISKSMRGKNTAKGEESHSYKDYVTKDQLTDLYVNQKLSTPQITKLTGLSYTTIISRLRKHGIKVRLAGKPRKPIKCTTDGNIFESLSEAAQHYNLHKENIRKVLNGKYKHTGSKQFAYVSDNRGVSQGSE